MGDTTSPVTSDPGPDLSITSPEQDAVRLLVLLHVAADSSIAEPAPETAVTCVAGEMRVQAMDFWLRNPDYLAWALLDTSDTTGDTSLVAEAARILSAEEEPDLRTVPMLRWRYGAWEALDDRLSLLASYGLAVDVRRGENLGGRRDIYLLEDGRQVIVRLLDEVPELRWYEDRARLVRIVAGDAGGEELKARQKSVWEYRDTRWQDRIAGIRPKVRERLAGLGRAA
jgi:hypothetical protein